MPTRRVRRPRRLHAYAHHGALPPPPHRWSIKWATSWSGRARAARCTCSSPSYRTSTPSTRAWAITSRPMSRSTSFLVAACMASVVCIPSRSAFDFPPPPAPTTYSFGLSALPQCIFRTMRVLGACFAPQLLRAKSSATLASAIGWLASRSHSLGHRRARGRLTK